MHFDPLAAVPLTSALLYAALFRTVSRRSAATHGQRAFLVFLAFMGANAIASATWRLTPIGPVSEYLLRLVELPLMGVAGAFLYLLQALYPTRWAARAKWIAAATLLALGVASLSGAVNRIIVPGSQAETIHLVLFSVAMTAIMGCYVVAYSYLIAAYRTNKDPFERNRLKYIGVATFMILVGGMTNLVNALRMLPVDQAVNAAAAGLLSFSILRYRLFDIDIVMRKGVVRVLIGIPTSFGYVGGLLALVTYTGIELASFEGVASAVALGFAVAFVAGYVRAGAERLADHLFVGGHLDIQEALAELTRRTSAVRAVDDLGRDIVEFCQPALDASFVGLMLLDSQERTFELSHLAGPFPRLQPEWTVRVSNALFQAMAQAGDPVTPLALERVIEAGAFPSQDVAEFGPYRDCIAVPILGHGQPIGLLFVGPKVYDTAFSLADIDFLHLVASQAALSIQNATLFGRLREAAETDFVTTLPNHRHLQDLFQNVLLEAEQSGETFCVAMADIDNFKLFNDVHGHQVGDDALRRLSTVMRSALRPQDVVGRYGGDEFMFILPGLTKGAGSELLAQVARTVKRTALAASEGAMSASDEVPARISWGLASYPEDGVTRRNLTSVADSQLLQRKIEMRRSGTVHTERPNTGRLLERDPEKLRIARALLDIIDAKDPYTSEHSQQIASFALLIADEVGMPDRDRYALWLGSLLHDVGKIGTPSDILRKPGRLTPEEWDLMRQHPMLGESMVKGLLDIDEVIQIVGCHHERFDGSGYPRGLVGEDIPRLARMVSVADAFSAMVHDRPYRKGLSWDEAVAELRRHAGTQFDPDMVELFIKAIGYSERQDKVA